MSEVLLPPGEASAQMLVSVLVPGGKSLRRNFPLGVPVTVGRDVECHLVLPSPLVSRRHAVFSLTEAGFVVEDHSRSGIFLDGERIHQSKVVAGKESMKLKVGPYEVCLQKDVRADTSASTRRRAHDLLLERLNLMGRKLGSTVTAELRAEVNRALEEIVLEPDLQIDPKERRRLVSELLDEALGLGPLEALLKDPRVSEIMVVDPQTIYAERAGRLELTGRGFTDGEAVRSAIERIVTPLGRRIDESSPLVDARLPDGSRVNAVIPPLALRGPCITIRKFPSKRLSMGDLVAGQSLNERMARFIRRSVELRKNIVISGGTGSGKTTLLNVLSASIGSGERVVTIEDAAELSLAQDHVVGLESKPPNLEGRGEFTIRDLVKNALRMRPDRIVVGECRGGEALDMLQAMNTGHEGSMTTTHANSPAQAVRRLETLCLMAGVDLPLAAIRRQIAGSVDLIVQQSRLSSGERKITSITEVTGLGDEGDFTLRELFRLEYDPVGGVWLHAATGFLPSFLPELERVYSAEPEELF